MVMRIVGRLWCLLAAGGQGEVVDGESDGGGRRRGHRVPAERVLGGSLVFIFCYFLGARVVYALEDLAIVGDIIGYMRIWH